MSKYYYSGYINEPTYGSSTSFVVETNAKGIISKVLDTSDHTTNYVWDNIPSDMVGKHLSEVRGQIVFEDEYRQAWVVIADHPFALVDDRGIMFEYVASTVEIDHHPIIQRFLDMEVEE